MKLEHVGSNQTVVTIGDRQYLFSYNTPVAYKCKGINYITDKFWSKTTSTHINRFIGGKNEPFKVISQDKLDMQTGGK